MLFNPKLTLPSVRLKSCSDCWRVCWSQEEYKNGDDLGTLECGHEFHHGCIKQWLQHKNSCPICKSTGFGAPWSETGFDKELVEEQLKGVLFYVVNFWIHEAKAKERKGTTCDVDFPFIYYEQVQSFVVAPIYCSILYLSFTNKFKAL